MPNIEIEKIKRKVGRVKFFNLNRFFGFITLDEEDYFFHGSDCKPEEIDKLDIDVCVTFVSSNTARGKKAIHVVICNDQD